MSDKKGINDLILEKILKMDSMAREKIIETLKGQKPFASTKIDPDEYLWHVQHLSPEGRRELTEEFGQEAMFSVMGRAAEIMNKRDRRSS